jgi:hypothetical protein
MSDQCECVAEKNEHLPAGQLGADLYLSVLDGILALCAQACAHDWVDYATSVSLNAACGLRGEKSPVKLRKMKLTY